MTTYFDRIFALAIADLVEHGFTDQQRVAYWVGRLKAAAETSYAEENTNEKVRRLLSAVYRRLVERGGIAKFHPDVNRFTIARLSPLMRAELDKRIMASVNLIKLNREQAIAKTLQRFAGWSTSIPAGGSDTVNRREIKEEIAKPLRQQNYAERRVVIDQGHKLAASINEVVAQHSGAIALTWHSHWRVAGYHYREDHRERDGSVYLLRNSWADERNLVKPGRAGYYDQVTAVGEEPFCRCYAQFIYSPKELPSDMLTEKGEKALREVAA
jgi:hypothetical protein